MYEFLNDFHERMKIPAMYETLVMNSHRKDFWAGLGIATVDRQMNVLFAVLLYIKEKSLLEEPCTESDVAMFLKDILMRGYGINVSSQKAFTASRIILQDILANRGSLMEFPVTDFNHGGDTPETMRFLETSGVEVDGRQRVSYRLSEDAYLLIFSGKEIPDQLQMNMHTYIMGQHLRAQSYGSALAEGKELLDRARARRIFTENEVLSLRRNPHAYRSADLIHTCNTNIESYHEIAGNLKQYRQLVEKQIEDFAGSNLTHSQLDDRQEASLANLKSLNRYLEKIEVEIGRLVIAQERLKNVYLEETMSQLDVFRSRTISLKDNVLAPALNNPDILNGIADILHPMLIKNIDKVFNPQMAFDMRDITPDEEEKDTEDDLNVDTREAIRIKQERLAETRAAIHVVFIPLLKKILENPGGYRLTDYAMFANALPEQEKEQVLNKAVLKSALVHLLTSNEIEICAIDDEAPKKTLIYFSDELIQAALICGYSYGDRLEIVRMRGEPMAIFEYGKKERSYSMKCTEIKFTLQQTKRKGEHEK